MHGFSEMEVLVKDAYHLRRRYSTGLRTRSERSGRITIETIEQVTSRG